MSTATERVSTTIPSLQIELPVSRIETAAAFLRALLGVEPLRMSADAAAFQSTDPPLLLTLRLSPSVTAGAVNHLGLRVANATQLDAIQQRLEHAGWPTVREEGVECCYAAQTKFWITDPDQRLWEVYTLDDDLPHAGFGGVEDESAGVPMATLLERGDEIVGQVIYRGPLPCVRLDDGNLYPRGFRLGVNHAMRQLLQSPAFRDDFIHLPAIHTGRTLPASGVASAPR